MDIKKSIAQKVNQTVESLVSDLEDGYIAYIIGNNVIRADVKLDAHIEAVYFSTPSHEPIVLDLVRELNADYGNTSLRLFDTFFGSSSNPMLRVDDFYYLAMIRTPHLVTQLERIAPVVATTKPSVPFNELVSGDWVWLNYGELDVCNFALVYMGELYSYNFKQLIHEPIEEKKTYYKLQF